MIVALLGLIVIMPLWLKAQEGPFRKVLYKDQWGNERNCILEFWDVSSNTKIKSIDLLRENPLGKMGFPRIRKPWIDTADILYDLSGKKVGDFLSAAEMSGYYPQRRSPNTPLEYGRTSYRCYEISQDKIMVIHSVYLGVDDAFAGNLVDIRIYDSQGEVVWRIPRYDRACGDIKLSPDKRYMSHNIGLGDEYGSLFQSGVRVLDLKKKLYFDIPAYQPSVVDLTNEILYCSDQAGGDSSGFFYNIFRIHLKDNVYDSARISVPVDARMPSIFTGFSVTEVYDKVCSSKDAYKKEVTWRKFEDYWDIRGSLIIK
jgi:hypothetical protein